MYMVLNNWSAINFGQAISKCIIFTAFSNKQVVWYVFYVI